jgi:hypothetical protein
MSEEVSQPLLGGRSEGSSTHVSSMEMPELPVQHRENEDPRGGYTPTLMLTVLMTVLGGSFHVRVYSGCMLCFQRKPVGERE